MNFRAVQDRFSELTPAPLEDYAAALLIVLLYVGAGIALYRILKTLLKGWKYD